jgi:hypothetical protein
LIIDNAKSSPYRSAFCTISRLSSKLGMYCGEVVEISQPLLPIGMKTPMSMIACQHCDVPSAAGNMHAKSRNSAARPMP